MQNLLAGKTARALEILSFVVPCHNEGENTELLYKRIGEMSEKNKIDFELIFVDDSNDQTPLHILKMNQSDPRVKMIRLTRSYGQSVAIFAGLEASRGNAVIVMDSDLEDPPESVPLFLEQWQEGFDVVVAERKRVNLSVSYRLFSNLYYYLSSKISQVEIPRNVGEFRLLDRRVVDVLLKFPERVKFFRGLTLWPGFKIKILLVQREARTHGVTNYNFMRAASVAIDGLVSFSLVPLRLIAFAGILMSGVSVLATLSYFVWKVASGETFEFGWASMGLLMLFTTSINLCFLGIVAEYVGRIFQQVQGRPQYVVDYKVGF